MDDSAFPDPEDEGGGSLARVFLLALGLMVVLTIVIFNSGLWEAIGKALVNLLS